MDDIITIIIVLIFFVIPLLRKIFQAAGGNPQAQQRKQAAVKDIRKYLEQMQGSAKNQGGYKAPATRPARGKVDVVGKVEAILHQESVSDPAKLKSQSQAEIVQVRPAERNYINEMVSSQRFSDVQKAVIMSEIFQLPKTLR